MNIEEIRARHNQDEADMNKVSKALVHEDRGYLLSLIDRYKKALEEINKIEPLPGEYTIAGVIKNIVKQVLEKE